MTPYTHDPPSSLCNLELLRPVALLPVVDVTDAMTFGGSLEYQRLLPPLPTHVLEPQEAGVHTHCGSYGQHKTKTISNIALKQIEHNHPIKNMIIKKGS